MYISTQDEFNAFCESISHAGVIAVDTEFLREKTYYPKLCLIQVAVNDQVAAIDPILIGDLSPLADIFEDPCVTKVFHSCTQDLEVIYDGMDGCQCNPVFDTQLGAAFLRMRQQVSLAELVQTYCGVTLPKTESLTDWSQRPLDPEQLSYAEDDVRYLPGIYERMLDELVRLNRLWWIEPEMAELTNPTHFQRDPRDAYKHLRRSGSLTRKQLAVAREVCAWREQTAAQRDMPRRWVMSDELVCEISKRSPTSVDRLRRIRGTEQISDHDAYEIVGAVRKGLNCPVSEYPEISHRPHPSAETEGVLDLMNAVVKIASESTGVASQLIATRDDLLDYLDDPASSRLSQSWRYTVVGSTFEGLLSGKVGLTVKNGRVVFL